MPQPAWLVYGPPGCGKTTWILNQVKAAKRKLFHWNARTDRTLREGRENLHRQVRSQEPLYVWIEGADDLTSEAQAFLRRILETASQPVQCVLECRDPQRITPAIQSRCEWKQCPTLKSFRKVEDVKGENYEYKKTCRESFLAAENPIEQIRTFLKDETREQALISLKAVGAGSSAWAHLFYLRACASQEAKQHPTET